MHTFTDYSSDDGCNEEIKGKHSKVEFKNLEELLDAFKNVKRRLAIDKSLPWTETNSSCGYDLPEEIFKNIVRAYKN